MQRQSMAAYDGWVSCLRRQLSRLQQTKKPVKIKLFDINQLQGPFEDLSLTWACARCTQLLYRATCWQARLNDAGFQVGTGLSLGPDGCLLL
jgi:hypothetical protein